MCKCRSYQNDLKSNVLLKGDPLQSVSCDMDKFRSRHDPIIYRQSEVFASHRYNQKHPYIAYELINIYW